MYGKSSRKGYAPKRKFARKPRKVARKTGGLATKSYVKKLIHSSIENKTQCTYATNQTIGRTVGTGSTPFNINLLPVISQGAAEGERIGNDVRIVKSYMDMYINLLPYSSITNPVIPLNVKVWVVSKKNQNLETNQLSANDCNSFFQVGVSSVPFQGNMLDMIFPVNKDSWTIHTSRSFELSNLNTSGFNSSPTTNEGFFSKHLKIPLSKYYKKLKYSDTSFCTNHNMWLIVQTVNTDGSTNVLQGAEAHYSLSVEYEDA